VEQDRRQPIPGKVEQLQYTVFRKTGHITSGIEILTGVEPEAKE
jgi:hypothetical protein